MSSRITLFSGYSQSENRTTNYCLLLLKMIYEENPKFLAEALARMVGEALGERIGVKFSQQEKKTSSVPDGVILQPAFTVYIETKNFNWFYDDQLEKHLEALNKENDGLKVLIALSNFDDEVGEQFQRILAVCKDKYHGDISFHRVSFEKFLESVSIPNLPKNLQDTLADFRDYLDEQELLPSWKNRLDVVNCAGLPDDVLEHNTYVCPATGGAYNHARCRYFGMYRNKCVEYIAEIEAVVDLEDDEQAQLKWLQSGLKGDFIAKARTKVDTLQKVSLRPYPLRVFLLGKLFETNFQKDTPGGMFPSKQYFLISKLKPVDANDLATQLNGKTWSQLQG